MAVTNFALSPDGTNIPEWLLVINSGIPPTFVAITGILNKMLLWC